MTDSPSSILLLRLQSAGSNTNLWGGYLNTAMQTLERASKGYQALAVSGDATLSWTNYSPANDGSVAFLKLTGPISSAAVLTFPGLQHKLNVWNTAGQAVTIKCSGGAGVTIANGDTAELFCDGVDYYNAAPTVFRAGLKVAGALALAGKVSGLAAGTAGTDAVNLTQMAAAIAASVPAGTAGTFLNSIADTTRGFAADKIIGSGSITVTTLNPGGNEQMQIGFTFDEGQTALYAGVMAL